MDNLCTDGSIYEHICKIEEEEVGVTSNVLDQGYKCGGCSQELRTICQLHEHLLKEFLLGSYLYDHRTKTAYPKQDSVSAETQTDTNDQLKLDVSMGIDSEKVTNNPAENSGSIQQEDGSIRSKSRGKRKSIKRKEDALFEEVSKKKAKSKSSKTFNWTVIGRTIKEENIESQLLETNAASLETDYKQENNIKDETLDYNYNESTDDNYEEFHEIEQELTVHSEDEAKRKAKRKIKKKNKTRKANNKKVKNKVKVEALDKKEAKNEKNKTVEEFDKEFPDHITDEDSNPLNSVSDIKKRGRPKIKMETFTCKHCDSVFRNEKRYNVHLHSVHKSMYPFSCKQCNFKPFRDQEAYQDHKEKHPKQSYHCELCGKELKSREGLKLHELIHSGEKPFCCDQCDYKGRTSTQLRQHMYTHMDTKTEQCEHCGKAFFTKGKLKEHLRYCRKEFNHHCPHCQKGFPTASGLRKHILMHTGERAFICDVCGFATFRITLLNSHMRTHTGEKPYKCKECGAQLATRGTLLLHLRTHTHEKPFVCSYCSKAFTSKWNLQTHLRQHTGETPYKCDICGQGFKQNVLRKSHMRSHLESAITEPNIKTHQDQAVDLHVTTETDFNEHSVHSHLDTDESIEPVNLLNRKMEPEKLHLNNFVYDRSNSGDILNQALQSEELHPLDLKLHFTSASDLKNMYNNSVISSHQLQSNSYEMINYQDIKHV